MIHDLKPYPAYKDSGVPWLGKVPEHWEIETLRRRLRPYDGMKIGPFGSQLKLEFMTTSGYKVYGQANVIKSDFSHGNKFVDKQKFDELSACQVLPRDLLLTMMGTNGRCALVPDEAELGIMDSHLLRLRLDQSTVFGHFVALIIDQAPYIKEQIALAGKGSIMQGLNSSIVKNFILALPPISEQSAIVHYLDHIDRRIRYYIRAKKKLIKLLEEQKQAIIHQAVTRGLDPNVKLKPSGVEWLGDVPEHWEIVNLGRLIQLTTGFPFKSESFSQNTDDIRLLRGINVSPDRIRWDSVVRWSVADRGLYSSYSLKVGDIVLGMDRPVISTGIRVAKVQSEDVPSLLLQRVCILRPTTKLNNEYMLLLLRGRSFSNYLAPIFTGISVPHISPEQIYSFRIALPPISEQLNIVKWVRQNTSKIELAVDSARREIFLLREYRTRLIADVVTGKLDVREAAANLPEETDETETLDDALVEDDELENNEIENEQTGELEEEVLA